MLNGIAKLTLTSTSIAPVLLTYGWVAYQGDYIKIKTAVILFFICAVLVGFCLWLLRYAKDHLELMKFEAGSVEAADRENIAFLFLYLHPLFTAQFEALNWQVWLPAIVIFAAVVATGYNYHFNPLLGLMGWHFYKVGTKEGVTYVLITKKQLRNASEVIVVGQLTEYIVIELGDK